MVVYVEIPGNQDGEMNIGEGGGGVDRFSSTQEESGSKHW